ncbi:MAG: DUF1571 domain-containing protein [Deltaproteobacteria bacterium]|nr:DUF1571 domain-containing protein [Deltaproteobacteria bacterium]
MQRTPLLIGLGFALALCLTHSNTATAQEQTPGFDEILDKCIAAMKGVKDYTAIMHKQERFVDELGPKEKMFVKFSRPFKVYIKFLTVHTGREALYVRGWNDGEVRVHKGSFPDITVNLDPQGDMAMEGNHHPILHFGLEMTMVVAKKQIDKAKKRGEGDFKIEDGGKVDGKPTWKIVASFPRGGYNTTAKDDETLWDISKRTGQDMYVIMYANKKEYDEPDDPDEGDKVFIPRYYAPKSEFWLDRKTLMPLKVVTLGWDGKMYESFEYHDLKINPGLTANDFNPDNKKYDF